MSRKWSKRDYDLVRNMWTITGMTLDEIALHFGCSRSAIASRVRKLCLCGSGLRRRRQLCQETNLHADDI